MIIYCDKITPRYRYIFDYVFTNRLGISYALTSNKNEFIASDEAQLNYSDQNFDNVLKISPVGLLSEDFIRTSKPVAQKLENRFIMFPSPGSIGFDIFSAIFWFISRYEEYQTFTPDKYNRFPATESFSHQRGILHEPVVDQWIMQLKELFRTHFPELTFKQEIYNVQPTIDVDSPWCYQNKGFKRNLGGLARDYWKANFKEVLLRLLVLLRLKPDPWYQFNWMQGLFSDRNLKPIYFIHVGNYGKYDKTVSHRLPQFKKLVKNLKNQALVGLHPSYEAGKSKSVFETELKRIQKLTGDNEVKSRQHYLTIRLPHYYQALAFMGVCNDYSMGFADRPGFRAGTSRPFLFYDLSTEKVTSIWIHPFCVMDRTLKNYEKLSDKQVLNIFKELAVSLKKVNGSFVSLWHNETFSDKFEWKGWKQLFINILDDITRI